MSDLFTKFILAAANPWPTADQKNALHGMVSDPSLPWDEILLAAERVRVAPLIWWNLRRVARDIPPVQRQYLQAVFLFHQNRNAVLADEAGAVIAALAGEGVAVLVRKGLYLANHVYPKPATRRMHDMDLLIDKATAGKAVDVLTRLGYQAGLPSRDFRRVDAESRERRAFWRMYTNNLPAMFRPASSDYAPYFTVDFTIDLFLPAMNLRSDFGALLERSAHTVIGGTPTQTLSAEDFLLDLCAHTYKESVALRYIARRGHQRLIQYSDIAALVADPAGGLDWSRFLVSVAEFNAAVPSFFTLGNFDRIFPGALPDGVVETLAERSRRSTQFLDEYGVFDGESFNWGVPLADRILSERLPTDLPNTRSLV